MMIVHICRREEWEPAIAAGCYRAASLDSQGFIHASRPEQAITTANRFFAGAADLLLLWIDPQRLMAPLVFEPADDESFPHIYGALNLDAVVQVCEFQPEADGVFRRMPEI
jgi:uncharacterized protein (DUF952 family)